MTRPVAFWDSSALVPLCVNQAFTPQSLSLERKYKIAVWWSTHVEIVSALAQLLRQHKLTANDFAHAKNQAEHLANIWLTVAPSAKIASQARVHLESYSLRAADALQLAAAMEWCEGQPDGKIFLTFDARLREAARSVGFTLE